MRFSTLFVCCLLMNISIEPAAAQLIVGHRGASHDAPENTLAAFQLAWKQGADAIEGDFYLTSDQQIICVHDKDTKRLCPNHPVVKIAETDLRTLQKLDVGSWKDPRFSGEKMPTLTDVLAIVPPEKQIFIEIKCGPEIVPVLTKELAQTSLKPGQIVLICFDAEVILQCRKSMPQYRANWLARYKPQEGGKEEAWHPEVKDVLKTLKETGATGLGSQSHEGVLDQTFVSAITDAGFEFHVWTVNDPPFAAKLKSFGTMSLTTDRPEFLRSNMEKVSGK